MYGPLNTVVPTAEAERWIERLLDMEQSAAFSLLQLARLTGDRYRDIGAAMRERVLGWLDRHVAPEHYRQLVAEGGELEEDEAGLMFGESLPPGLRLTS
jgi:hypothetical protein